MSKRASGEEWSDDDFDGYSLSGSPQKKHKCSQELNEIESSGSGFFRKTIKRITSSVNNFFKSSFSLSSDDSDRSQMSCESVRSQTTHLGMNQMNQNNNTFRINVRTDQQLIQSPILLNTIQMHNNSQSSNYLVIQSSPQQLPHIIYSQSPVHLISNTTPIRNNSVVMLPTTSTPNSVNNTAYKCSHCGQINSSPITMCRHCSQRSNSSANRSRPSIASNQSISSDRFYNHQELTGVTRYREHDHLSPPTVNRSLNSSNSSNQSKQHLNQLFGPKQTDPEVIEIDLENGVNQMTSQDDDCLMETNGNNSCSAETGVGNQCNIENSVKIKSIQYNTNNSTKEIETTKDVQKVAYPDYAMFGTYKTEPKMVEFMPEGIKLTNVTANKQESKFKYHIMIPFVEMQELLYCSDTITNLLFIKPTIESNLKIQESMDLGYNSWNGLKFDVKSEDSKELYIIVVLKETINEKYMSNLCERAKNVNKDIEIRQISTEFGKHTLNLAKTRETNSSCKQVQVIANQNKSLLKTPPNQTSRYSYSYSSANRTPTSRSLYRGASDASDCTPSPSRSFSNNRRCSYKSPVQPIIEIMIADDEDDEEIITADDRQQSEFDKVIFIYPKDDKNAIHLIGTDIKCLNRGEFLNDNIVNFYLRYFFNEKLVETMRRRTHIFDTFFFLQLTEKRPAKRKNSVGGSGREEYTFEQRYEQKLRKWTKNIEIFAKDFLIFPIIKESHWFLSIVCYPKAVYFSHIKCDKDLPIIEFSEETSDWTDSDTTEKRPCIIFMDSLGNGSIKKSLSHPIREFLSYEWKHKYKCDLSFKAAKDIKDFAPHVPNQTNSSDCGLFLLEYVEQFLKCPDILVKKLFDSRKNGLLDWFENDLVKTKRQEIRSLILSQVSTELKEKLETLIDDSKLSDSEDLDEIGMEITSTSYNGSTSKISDEQQLQEVL